MSNAKKDNNNVDTLLVTSNGDGTTPVLVQVNPSTGAVSTSDGSTGSDLSGNNAARDANYVPVLMGVSSVDGVTPTPVYGDPATGEILIQST